MQRGCAISIISASLAILCASVVLRIFLMPEYQYEGTSKIIYVIELAVTDYNKDYGSYPTGGNQSIAKVLLGDNSRNKAYLASDSIVMRNGQFVDLWKRPLRLIKDGSGITVLSAGENGAFDDADDITSGRAFADRGN